jgi:hypothetical protein
VSALPCAVHRGHEPGCRGCRAYASTLRSAAEREAKTSTLERFALLVGQDVPAELAGDIATGRTAITRA